jgi:hypothetical protein
MFSFLFGKSKPIEPPLQHRPATTIQEVKTRRNDIADTMSMLQGKETDLEKRIDMLEKKSTLCYDEAKKANQAGQKEKAMLHLRKRAMYDEQLKTNNAMLLKIIQQKVALETTMINTGSLDAMNVAAKTMKTQQTAWSSERVADLTDEMHEVMDTQREITDMMRAPLTTSDISEDDLEAEFAGLSAVQDEAELTKSLVEPPSVVATETSVEITTSMPSVPSGPITIAKEDTTNTMLRELANLE